MKITFLCVRILKKKTAFISKTLHLASFSSRGVGHLLGSFWSTKWTVLVKEVQEACALCNTVASVHTISLNSSTRRHICWNTCCLPCLSQCWSTRWRRRIVNKEDWKEEKGERTSQMLLLKSVQVILSSNVATNLFLRLFC